MKRKPLENITQSQLAKELEIKHNSIILWRKKGKRSRVRPHKENKT